jgi:hypothetical protein
LALSPQDHRIYLVSAEFAETAAPQRQPRPRRTMKPDTFTLLVVGEKP